MSRQNQTQYIAILVILMVSNQKIQVWLSSNEKIEMILLFGDFPRNNKELTAVTYVLLIDVFESHLNCMQGSVAQSKITPMPRRILWIVRLALVLLAT